MDFMKKKDAGKKLNESKVNDNKIIKELNKNEIKEKDDLTKKYVDEGMSIQKISNIYKCDWYTIKRKLKKYGIDTRPRGSFLVDENGETLSSKLTKGEINSIEYENIKAKSRGHENYKEYRKYEIEDKRKKGESPKNCKWTKEELEDMYAYDKQNLNPIQIGKLHNPEVNADTIRKWIDIFGIEKKTLLAEDGESLKSKVTKGEISTIKYENIKAEKRGFKDNKEYQKYIIEEKRKRKLNENEINEKDDLIKKYVDEEISIAKIANIYGCSRYIIDKKLREYGIDIKSQGSFLVDENGEFLKYKLSRIEYNNELAKNKGHKNWSEYQKHSIDEKRRKGESPKNCMWTRDEIINLYHEHNLLPRQIGKLHIPQVSAATILNWIDIFGIERKIESEIYGGENNHWYIDGKSNEPYTIEFTYKVREEVRDYWFRNCVLCGFPEENHEIKLSVHHVDYNKNQNGTSIEWKLVPLCNDCHNLTNYNRNYYEYLFTNFIKIREKLEKFDYKIDYKSIGMIDERCDILDKLKYKNKKIYNDFKYDWRSLGI